MNATGGLHEIPTFNNHSTSFSSRPPTVSAAVWEQLLQGVRPTRNGSKTNPTQPDISQLAPPPAPMDKNATSMRVLLHDTQSNFERFTVELENLFRSIAETKTEIKNTSSLYVKDRESLTSDIIDLVNRSQREVQKSLGEPAQAAHVESSFKDVNAFLSNINQRIDSIQLFNETHSRALQTQMQSIQMILDNQGKIISAVVPLLPLLQTVPPHLETLRSSISDTVEKSLWKNMDRKPASSSPPSSRKRKRSNLTGNESPLHARTPVDGRDCEPQKRQKQSAGRPTPKRTSPTQSGQQDSENVRPGPSHSIRLEDTHGLGVARSTPGHHDNASSYQNDHGSGLLQAFTTPRRPLVDTSNSSHRSPPIMGRKGSLTSAVNNSNNNPPPAQGDHSLRRLASAAPILKEHEMMPPPKQPINQNHRPTLSDLFRADNEGKTNQQGTRSNAAVVHSTPDARRLNMQPIFPSPRFFTDDPTPVTQNSRQQQLQTSSVTRPGLPRRTGPAPTLSTSTPRNPRSFRSINAMPLGQINIKNGESMLSRTSSRAPGGQSPQKVEGRRFIPLDDSDDEIENDDGV